MKANQPNILLLLPDQHRSDWIGCCSGPVCTPNIDGLASEGMVFDNAYTPSPLCGPARACLASGRNYGNCGVRSNEFNYPLSIPTYYQVLQKKGYFTVGVGKFDLHKDTSPDNLHWCLDGSRLINEWGFNAGIDCEGKMDGVNSYRFHGKPMGPYLSYLQEQGILDIHIREHDNRAMHSNAYTTALPDHAYCDNWVADQGLELLDGAPSDRPWHMVVNFVGPHSPMDVTQNMRAKWEDITIPAPHNPIVPEEESSQRARRNYAAMIENIDRLLGRFIEKVKRRGEYDNTVIVYASDHGDMLGDHGKWGKGTWRDPAVRVPLIIRDPLARHRGVRSGALVSLQDLAATFLDFAGCSKLAGMDSNSLRPLLTDERNTHRDALVSELGDWKLAFDGRYKLVVRSGRNSLLFDLEADRFEDNDMGTRRTELIAKLSHYATPAV